MQIYVCVVMPLPSILFFSFGLIAFSEIVAFVDPLHELEGRK